MKGGYVRISREMLDRDDPLWGESRAFSRFEAWLDLYRRAAWKPAAYTTAHGTDRLERGEFVASLRFLGAGWRWDKMRVSRFLAAVEKAGRIVRQRDGKHGTVYLIANYDADAEPMITDAAVGETANETAVRQPRDSDETKKKQVEAVETVETELPTAPSLRSGAAPDDAAVVLALSIEGAGPPPARPTAPRAEKAAPWMGEIRDIWRAHYGGDPPKHAVRELRPLVTRHGVAEVVRRFAIYAAATPAGFVKIHQLSTTWGAWESPETAAAARGRGPPANGHGPHKSYAQMQREMLEAYDAEQEGAAHG